MTVQIKRCTACRVVKLRTEFYRHPQNRDGRQGVCKACAAEETPRRRHGLTRVEKAQMAVEQGGCLTCGTDDPGSRGWVVDHDHRCCGPVNSCDRCRRGILCGRCNTALGMARDNPATLRALADYLDRHRDSVATPYTDPPTESLYRLAVTDSDVRTNERREFLPKEESVRE